MLTNGIVKILDFGLASLASEAVARDDVTQTSTLDGQKSGLTQAGALMGTPDYMAPAQARDARTADIRSDIYSLGCTLYCLLSGKAPFPGGTAIDKVIAHAEHQPRPIGVLRGDVPSALVQVIDKMMAKNPARRYRTPAEAATDLARFTKAEPGAARPRSLWRRAGLLAIAAGIVVLVGGIIYVSTDNGELKIDSKVDDVQVVLSKGGRELEVIDLSTGSKVMRLPTGDYQVTLLGDRNDVTLDKSGFSMTRRGNVVVTVSMTGDGQQAKIEAATLAARDWLKLMDAAQFEQAWEQSAVLSKQAMQKNDTLRAYEQAQTHIGKLKWRVLHRRDFSLSPPGLPKGEYVQIQYASSYEKLDKALETINMVREKDGRWRQLGYSALLRSFDVKNMPASETDQKIEAALKNRPRPKPSAEIAPEHRNAIEKGLAYLVKTQQPDGFWTATNGQYPVAMTALSGMGLLMEGSTIRDGPYAATIRKAADWLIAQSQPNGRLSNPKEQAEVQRYMFGHGYAMLFLATLYGQEEDAGRRLKMKHVLEKAVAFSAQARTPRGGWGYVAAAEGNNFDEAATTITQLQGLRAARNAGIAVPRDLLDAEYLRRFTGPGGGVLYSVDLGVPSERPALTAAALAACEYDSELAKKWIGFCQTKIPLNIDQRLGHDEFMHYYYAQALYQLGEFGYAKLFPNAAPAERITCAMYRAAQFDKLAARQAADGSWPGSVIGPVYATACNLTILQLDNGFLPIYQRSQAAVAADKKE